MANYKFPDNFKWGSATSAHQVEGDNHNDWSEWEKSLSPEFISGKACDSYNRYEEDFNIAKQLNQNIHRFSIEWSRIEPEEGRFDEKEMQHYVNVVKSLRDRGIEPMITLWHFTNPVWFAQKGGFLNLNSPEYFAKYLNYVVNNLKDQVGLWITFNEATTVYSGFSFLKGLWPPQHKSLLEWRRVNKNLIKAHIRAYSEIKKIYNHQSPPNSDNKYPKNWSNPVSGTRPGDTSHNVEVGVAESVTFSVSGNNFYQKILGKIYDYYRNFYFWKKAFPYYDFVGLNYYHVDRRVPGSYQNLPKQEIVPEMGWEIYPEGIYKLLTRFKGYNKPIYITENGIADATDLKRAKFIKEHLRWVWQAINDGVDVRGYLYWSLLDNFEWAKGYSPRFGLVEVNYKTFERHIRPSAHEYAKICKENTLSI